MEGYFAAGSLLLLIFFFLALRALFKKADSTKANHHGTGNGQKPD